MPKSSDTKAILENLGKVILGLGAAMLIPLFLSLSLGEWKPALDLGVGFLSCVAFWLITALTCRTEANATWAVGMPTVALSWLVAMLFGAIPLYLSGHFGSFLDASFDCMSGLATTGLTVIQDLDHLSYGVNLWRHMIMFLGGQGIVVIVLALFVPGASWATDMYRGEGREDHIFPNIISTARFIWVVSLVYLIIGTLILWVTALKAGMPPGKGLFDSICIFMAGYDTGGFTPRSQGIIFYHSVWFECATMITMILGMTNFGVHYALWRGRRSELHRNTEMRCLAVTLSLTVFFAIAGLSISKSYPTLLAMFRRGFYQIVSGHSGTGFMTIYGKQFVSKWGPLALLAAIIAMGLGGASGSTSGGIKAIRVAISTRALWWDAKRLLLPPDAVIVHKYHNLRDIVVTERVVRNALLVTLCYILTYLGGALILTFYGYPLSLAIFESTSACANVGLTCGITSHAMPVLGKITFIAQMWMGRLEFISVFTLIGYLLKLPWRNRIV